MIRNTIGAPGLVNPQYRYALEDWCKCDDCFAGEREIKEAGETYLPRTEGQMADPQFGARRYEAYKSRANYFNYFFSTAATMLGILHREPPEAVRLPFPPTARIQRRLRSKTPQPPRFSNTFSNIPSFAPPPKKPEEDCSACFYSIQTWG